MTSNDKQGDVRLAVSPTGERLVLDGPLVAVVGYSGRDAAAVERHLAELAAHGVPRPPSVPAVWELEPAALEPVGRISADPARSSGEAEPVLVRHAGEWYLSVGSDHTDRELEQTSMSQAKAACPKVVAGECWRLADVEGRWDEVQLRSEVRIGGRWTDYQRGTLAEVRPLDDYLRRFAGRAGDLVVFCGTVPTLGGLVLGSDGFRATLTDPATDRSLVCEYGYQIGTGCHLSSNDD